MSLLFHFWIIYTDKTSEVSAGTCSSYSFESSIERFSLSNGQLHFYHNNLLCYSDEINKKKKIAEAIDGPKALTLAVTQLDWLACYQGSNSWKDSGSNPQVQSSQDGEFSETILRIHGVPPNAIKLVILYNSFVFLAFLLAPAFKERRVSTLPLLKQKLFWKSSHSYLKLMDLWRPQRNLNYCLLRCFRHITGCEATERVAKCTQVAPS